MMRFPVKRFAFALALALSSLSFAPALAVESVSTQQYAQGQLVYPTDLSGDVEAIRNLVGNGLANVLGATSFLPTLNPLAISLSSSALSLTVGGPGQSVIVLDSVSGSTRVVDSCPATTLSIPSNSTGSTRTDYVWVNYQQATTNPHVVPFSDGTNRTVYNTLESCKFAYATTSTAPTGFTALARVAVPSGASVGAQATVSYSMFTVAALVQTLANFPANSVTSLNGKVGAVTLNGSGGTTVTASGNTLTINTASGTTVNGIGGGVFIGPADSSMTVTTSGPNILLRANSTSAVNSLNGFNGSVTINSSDGSIGVTNSGGTISLKNNATATTVNGLGGAVNLNSPDGSLNIAPSGSNVNLTQNSFIGQTLYGATRITPGSGNVTASLPYALPSGTWTLLIQATFASNAGGTATVYGSGLASGGGGWEYGGIGSTASNLATGTTMELQGTGQGGDNPVATLSTSVARASGSNYYGLLKIWAVRRS